MNCVTGKVIYPNEETAIEALIQFQIRNTSGASGPTNVYLCSECCNWHFTSSGRHECLDDEELKKQIQKERIAYTWEQKTR